MFALRNEDESNSRSERIAPFEVDKRLAIDGGNPVRNKMLPYGRQTVDDDDVTAVVAALRSDWLTTGPCVDAFENELSQFTGAPHSVVVNNGTAALHTAYYAAGVQRGDEVIVPAMTFAATANAVVMLGAKPVFCDVDPDTLLIDPDLIEQKITRRTKAIVAVDYAGQPCNYEALRTICDKHNLVLIADACHSLGATIHHRKVGTLADFSCFSFHPVKAIATGEGGAVTTEDRDAAMRMKRFRNHNIASDFRQRESAGSWYYEIHDLGYNYRMTDLQAALGASQLKKLPVWVWRRRLLAREYDDQIARIPWLTPLHNDLGTVNAYHLYVVQLHLEQLRVDRSQVFSALRAEGIGCNVHYLPVHLHPFYQARFDTMKGDCPVAEAAYERILSLPMFPAMSDDDLHSVVHALSKIGAEYAV